MKSQFDRVLLYAVALAVLVAFAMGMRSAVAGPQIAFVDIGKMVNEYEFKKKLERSSAIGLTRIRSVIDSLEMLQKAGAVSNVDTQLAAARYAFGEYYERSNKEITKKVWERLNPLMEQYGKDHNLQLLVGATGTGNLLYGSKSVDVTEELTRYVNTRFEKGN